MLEKPSRRLTSQESDVMLEKEEIYLNLITENRNMIYKVASLYTTCNESREDLMQEIALQVWKSLASFKSRSSINTWLYRVALNTAIQFLKREKRNIGYKDLVPEVNELSIEPPSGNKEKINQMMSAIHKLKQIDRAIILMYLEGNSHKEISEVIDISTSNVGTKIQRIKEKLKSELL